MASNGGCVFPNSTSSFNSNSSVKTGNDVKDVKCVKHAVIVTAAGTSSRFNSLEDSNSSENSLKNSGLKNSPCSKKEFFEIDGIPVLTKAVKPFLEIPNLEAVVITYNTKFKKDTIESLKGLENSSNVPFYFVEGGATRQESVFNALSFLMKKKEEGMEISLVSIHDGCRPYVTTTIIENCLQKAYIHGGAAPLIPISDTIVNISNGFVSGTIDRTGAYCIQTPQTFLFLPIYDAHAKAHSFSFHYTDDSSLFLHYCHAQGFEVAMVQGSLENKKITFKEDLESTL